MWRSVPAAAVLLCSAGALAATSAPERREALVRLVRDDCGACHGLTLKGGLGSPLLPQSLAEKPDDVLVETILDGRPGTPMPPWRGMLGEDSA